MSVDSMVLISLENMLISDCYSVASPADGRSTEVNPNITDYLCGAHLTDYYPSRSIGEHTDFGSLTILFHRLGGLQILPPNSETWAYVKPLKHHCVVNLGDAMVKFTAGLLRSNIHRVVNPPGAQGDSTRLSCIFFSRPEDEVILKTLEGSEMINRKRKEQGDPESEEHVTSKEWTIRRAMGKRLGGNWSATLGTEGNRLTKE